MKKLILVALGAMFMFGGLANATEMMQKDKMGKDEMMKKGHGYEKRRHGHERRNEKRHVKALDGQNFAC